ncbi:MAG: DUF417 family protein [Acidobacteriaceae bacterium]
MSQIFSGQTIIADIQDVVPSAVLSRYARSALTRVAAWINDRHIAFWVISIGMSVMLFWAGSFKLTALGAESIAPLVNHSPLLSWQFKLFGPYIGSDMIGCTEFTAAILLIVGYFKPKAGIVGGLITTLMFFLTSSMLLSTPGATISYHGMRYMDLTGLFLFKDIISFGASFYLISYYGRRAIISESNG